MWSTSSASLGPLRTKSFRSVPACCSARSNAGSETKQTSPTSRARGRATLAANGRLLCPMLPSLLPCSRWGTTNQVCISCLATRSCRSLHVQGCALHLSANIWLCSLLNTLQRFQRGFLEACGGHVIHTLKALRSLHQTSCSIS